MASPAGKSQTATSDKAQLAKDRGWWGYLAAQRQKLRDRTIADDVEELLDHGFSHHMIGELLGVGSTELMRWKSTGVCLPEQQKAAHKLLAFCGMLEDKFGVASAATWFERWLVPTCIINMLEIYHHGHTDLVLNYAAGRLTGEQVLDLYEPEWREVPPSMWEVATNQDGEQYIRMKGEDGAVDA